MRCPSRRDRLVGSEKWGCERGEVLEHEEEHGGGRRCDGACQAAGCFVARHAITALKLTQPDGGRSTRERFAGGCPRNFFSRLFLFHAKGEAVDSNSKPTVNIAVKRHRSVNPTLVLPRHIPDRRRHLQNDIAIAVHTLPHRSVSLGLVAKALGAMPRAGRKKTNTGKVLEVAATSKVTSSSV